MALVDSNYEFIYVDVGKQGRISDSGALGWTKFYQLFKSGKLKFPPKEENTAGLNFVLIGDVISLTLTFSKTVFTKRT